MFKRLHESGAAVSLTIDGVAVTARAGDSVAAALLAAGRTHCRTTPVSGAPRAPYCMMGVCFDCLVTIDGVGSLNFGATAFVFPSLYEGFGFPVLEAMACGAPVVTSYAGALPEVVGDAAIQFDPTSVEGMAEVMRTLLSREDLRSELRQKGLERARQFSAVKFTSS